MPFDISLKEAIGLLLGTLLISYLVFIIRRAINNSEEPLDIEDSCWGDD